MQEHCQTGASGHFRAFSFVDRITSLETGARICGSYDIPPNLPAFSGSLAGEAVGQLAAWAAMAAVNFKSRPVAGIAGVIEHLAPIKPGQQLEIFVDMESVDDEAAAYRGGASVSGVPVIRLQNCVGPMLPVEEFDDPQALRERFALICGAGASPGAFGGLPDFQFQRTDGETGKNVRATFQAPDAAPFFDDHFPRRPVFPGSLLMQIKLELLVLLAAEISSAGAWQLQKISDMKLRAFISPGENLELEARLVERSENSAVVSVESRNAKRLVGAARALLTSGRRK
jgi:3-hydroxymyristoyl/3-hydroxydecanoyl-(acyl carrier protein) dehydratase